MLTKDYLVAQATLYETKQEWQNAIQAYIQAISRDPKNADLRNSLGIVYEKVAAFDYAAACYRQALEIDPNFYAARYHLMQLYRTQERVEDAQGLLAQLYAVTKDSKERKELGALLKEVMGSEVAVCDKCYCVSPYKKAFRRIEKMTLCPHCVMERNLPSNRSVMATQGILLFIFVALAAGTFFLISDPRMLSAHYLATNILLTIFAFFGFQILHEAVKAAVILLVGGKIHTIAFGRGDLLWKKQLGEIKICIGKRLGTSMTEFGFATPSKFLRLRLFSIFLVPALFHIGICIALWNGSPIQNLGSMYAIRDIIVIANCLMLYTLIPLKPHADYISDGLFILVLLVVKNAPYDFVAQYYTKEAMLALERKTYTTGLKIIEQGMKIVPYPHITLLGWGAIFAIDSGDLQKAVAYAEQLLANTSKNFDMQAHGLNCLAYSKILIGDREEAHKYAKEALRIRPWSAFEMATLGLVLSDSGDLVTGSRYLEESLRRQERHFKDDTYSKVKTSAALAYTYWQKRETAQAEMLLQEATATEDPLYILRHVRAKMQLQPQ